MIEKSLVSSIETNKLEDVLTIYFLLSTGLTHTNNMK